MDGDFIQSIIKMIVAGDTGSIIVILLGIISVLGWYCWKLLKQVEKKDEKVYKIIDDYSKNNITMTDALNGIKTVLIEIKAKI